jgi:hypothetical protein
MSKQKKLKMSSFFSSEVEIAEILSNNKAKVKKGDEQRPDKTWDHIFF